jgi:NADH-quinone oxidoreductase subunit F
MPLIERVLDRTACDTLDDHRRRGGCAGLDAARRSSRDTVIAEIEAAGLRGRGGAGFPTGVKWRTVAGASTPRSTPVVVNAAEGEPATFKDRQLIRMNPFKIIEGALIAAYAVDTDRVVIALKGTFGPESTRLRDAVAAMTGAGWTRDVDVQIVEGPSEYLFGEETGLLEVLEGRQPFPRVTPPYLRGVDDPRLVGDEGAPALVDNVETLANVPAIIAQGAHWYRSVGTAESPGTLVCTITGHSRRHGVGEVPMGTPLREAITLIGGGPADGRRIVAAMSGVANPLLAESQLDTPLSYEAMAGVGSGLGAGGFFVCDDETDIAAVVFGASRFLAVESCGQCEPCKRDGLSIAARLQAVCTGQATEQDLDELPDLLSTVTDGARCFLATQQQRVVGGALQTFPEAFRAHLDGVPARAEAIVPISDLVEDEAVLETSHLAKQPDWTYNEVDSGAWPAAALGNTPVEADVPRTRAVPDDAADVVATGHMEGPDPLQPLLDMHAGIRRALDRLAATDERARGGAIDELRGRLALHADVTRRVVHPMASRVAEAPADDAGWRVERDETMADRMLARLEGLDAARGDAASSLPAIVAEVREAVDRDESQILGLLRTHMDERDLRELGDAIHEACAASNVAIGRGPMTSAADAIGR